VPLALPSVLRILGDAIQEHRGVPKKVAIRPAALPY
jgi:hypothetical protein